MRCGRRRGILTARFATTAGARDDPACGGARKAVPCIVEGSDVAQHQETQAAQRDKLSGGLRRRLAQMKADRPVRAVVLLEAATPAGRGQDRQEAIRAVRKSAATAKTALGPLLLRVGGHWLDDEPDALGSIGVETTPAGLFALADSDYVKAILEDQRVFVAPGPRRVARRR